MIQAVFGGLTGAGGTAVLLALLSWLRGKKADRAGVNRTNIDAALAVQAQSIEYVQHMMGPLEKRLKVADGEVDELRRKVRELTDHLSAAGEQLDRATQRAEAAERLLATHGLPLPARRDEDWGNR